MHEMGLSRGSSLSCKNLLVVQMSLTSHSLPPVLSNHCTKISAYLHPCYSIHIQYIHKWLFVNLTSHPLHVGIGSGVTPP